MEVSPNMAVSDMKYRHVTNDPPTAGPLPGSTAIISHPGVKVKPSAKVFVVDDDPAVLKSLESILTSRGYTAKCFSSAEEFLAEHHPSQVGCVLIDMAMSGMNGSELLERLQESGSLLSVVVISGLIDERLLERMESESVPKLEKPYEISTLLQMVQDGVAGSIRRRNVFQNRKRRG
jgi:two-component system, LuxR family, response regulator FixJ